MTLRMTVTLLALLVAGCQTAALQPLPTVERVELPRFMGDWYVIASIPTYLERHAYNAVESYRLTDAGTVATTFRYRKGGFHGKVKRYHFTGYIKDAQSNAVWGLQLIWPFKADYRVMYLAPDYSTTIIGRLKRDYVWIMARSPKIEDAEYQRLVRLIAAAGYDTAKIEKARQHWPEATLTHPGPRSRLTAVMRVIRDLKAMTPVAGSIDRIVGGDA